MEFSLDSLQPKERASFALRALYEAAGLAPSRIRRLTRRLTQLHNLR